MINKYINNMLFSGFFTFIFSIFLMIQPNLSYAVMEEGDSEFALSGNIMISGLRGEQDASANISSFLMYGKFLTKNHEIGLIGSPSLQLGNYNSGNIYGGPTYRYNILGDNPKFVPYFGLLALFGASIYENYDGGTETDFLKGFLFGGSAGLKYFVSEKTSWFIEGTMNFALTADYQDIGDPMLSFGFSTLF